MIIIVQDPTAAEFAAAVMSGFAIELRPDRSARFISSGEHVIELDALKGRLADVLPCEKGAVGAAPLPSRLPPTSGYLTPAEME